MKSRKVTQTFTGRVEWLIGGAGYFKLLKAIAPVDVELYSATGQVLEAIDAEEGFYQRIGYERVVITSPTTQEVTWIYAPDEGGTDRFALEVVIFADGETRDGKAFLGSQSLGAVAAQFGTSQIKNPAGSAKTVYVDAVSFSNGTTAGNLHMMRWDADLLNAGAESNKDIGGAAPIAELRNETRAALGATVMMNVFVVANSTFTIGLNPPIRLEAGEGLAVQNGIANQQHVTNFQWREYVE